MQAAVQELRTEEAIRNSDGIQRKTHHLKQLVVEQLHSRSQTGKLSALISHVKGHKVVTFCCISRLVFSQNCVRGSAECET